MRRPILGTALAAALLVPLLVPLLAGCAGGGQPGGHADVRLIDVAPGWADNSVNAVIFRRHALVSDREWQFIAFYDAEGRVVLGRRKLAGTSWELSPTQYQGNVRDAHNSISIGLDAAGVLHVAFDHHNGPLRYARGTAPHALALGAEEPMTGRDERSVTYPEFHSLAGGAMLFLYRDGGSGRGNLVVNRYDPAARKWSRLHDNLISGEGRRNAYWQAAVDGQGTVHVSWTWRESPDVASNHDIAYARSRDGGVTWEDSGGRRMALPITEAGAEVAARVPQKSELINQTAMYADGAGRPYIATYWRKAGETVPQYRIVHLGEGGWRTLDLPFRRTPFSLSGMGTKAIPVSRPQLVVDERGANALLLFRDEERGNRVSAALVDIARGSWTVRDLAEAPVGAWEPNLDPERWRRSGELSLFVQDVRQADGEGLARGAPTMVRVLAFKPKEWNR
ncbi:BNR repeat-containing protein [Pseudoduganella sp. SL102]|uniref:BNR repeat-containing protein n=1 Tax=Pseudoduganella sp. SL102 TaxID=2995154 RepID=UPI00248A934E|nr:BNR repeat-containing protein [Pseudoduganella sp. SL102]WBS01025.1 BNR repeat-containing protein [Pseudoduganella sp. SL102]